MSKKDAEQLAYVRHNKMVHDEIAASYEEIHTEIYNPTEQGRLAHELSVAISAIYPASPEPLILDFGAGTGNLTGHLLALGAKVLASDVSPHSLEMLRRKHPNNDRVQFLVLNGTDLSNLEDNSVDMVATYSVLHHVPDYLSAVEEFLRVVRPGGVIFVDHESADHVWSTSPETELRAYQNALEKSYGLTRSQRLVRKAFNLFSLPAWRRLINYKVFGLHPEGDIHVTKADHIEWQKIEAILKTKGDLLTSQDYLVCRERLPGTPLYHQYRDRITDMHMVVCRKR